MSGSKKFYILRVDEKGNQCLYDETGEKKLICGEIYDILDYVKKRGGGTIIIETITPRSMEWLIERG